MVRELAAIQLLSSLVCIGQTGVPSCQVDPPYSLVVRERTDSVGSDVIVKYGPPQHTCLYRVEGKDFEIKDVNTSRFIKVADPYLFLGGGTGPDGGTLVVYDLQARTKLYEHNFSGNTVSFVDWVGPAKREQCPADFDRFTKHGLTTTLAADVSFKLEDLSHPQRMKTLARAKQRCIETQ